MKKIAIYIISFIAVVLLYFFGPALLDRLIGIADRSTKGTFKENRYTYKLSEKSDMLPFHIALLPDTDISKKYIHAIVGFHYYPIMDQDPTENRYYEFKDDASLTLSNNLLITETIGSISEDYLPCRKSSLSYALLYNLADEEDQFFALNYKDKKQIPLYSGFGLTEPIAIGSSIYWTEIRVLDDEREISTLVCFNPENNSRKNLMTCSGSLELMDADSLHLLLLGVNYDNDEDMFYRYNTSSGTTDSVFIAAYGSYIIDAFLIDSTVYFPLTYDEYEDDPTIGIIDFNPNSKLTFTPLPQYQQSGLIRCKVGRDYAVLTYRKGSRQFSSIDYAVILSLKSGKEVKRIENISGIGINDKYLFYVTKKLNRMGLIENAEIVVEELSSLQ